MLKLREAEYLPGCDRGPTVGTRSTHVIPTAPKQLIGGITDIVEAEGYDVTLHPDKQDFGDALEAYMSQHGWSFVDSGFYSMVFIDGSGRALKVCANRRDTGMMYAAWCRANQDLPHVPRIYDVRGTRNCYLVLMEELYPSKLGYSSPELLAIRKGILAGLENDPPDYPDYHPTLYRTAVEIGSFFAGISCQDIYGGNVMMRTNGALVITDPLAEQSNTG